MELSYEDARSAEARRISESEIFRLAWDNTKQLLIDRLLKTDPVDHEKRELYYQRICLLDELKNAFVKIMNEGDIKNYSKIKFDSEY